MQYPCTLCQDYGRRLLTSLPFPVPPLPVHQAVHIGLPHEGVTFWTIWLTTNYVQYMSPDKGTDLVPDTCIFGC